MSTPVSFEKTSTMPLRFSKKLGRCVGWGAFSKKAGEEYDDEHGDHFPDDELFGAVGGLMKMDFKDREIDIEHLGAAQGSIVTAWAMTEDVAKSIGCDTGGNYGVLLDFEPAAELLKSIEDGEMCSLSMYGTAIAEPVAKSAGAVDVSAAKRKRVMRDVKLTKWAVCKSPAHVGAGVTLVKSTPSDELLESIQSAIQKSAGKTRAFAHVPVAKRTPAATSSELGHQHSIHDADEKDGYTSYETAEGSYGSHSHSWIKGADGTITVLEALGHTHTIATEIAAMSNPTELAKAQTDLTAAQGRCTTLSKALLVLAALPVEQQTFAKRYTDAGTLEGFLGKSDADRAALAKPIHKSERTGRCFYAGEESLAEMAKDSDALAEKLAKSEKAAEFVTFEKRAEEVIKHWPGTLPERAAIMKAVDGIADEALKTAAIEKLKAADVAFESITKRVGHSGGAGPVGNAEAALEAGLSAFAKANNMTTDQALAPFSKSDEGKRLYAAAYPLGGGSSN